MLYLAFIILMVAAVLFWQAGRKQKAAGLPAGRIIYADTRRWVPAPEPLFDPELGLTGRPDYLVQQGGQVIPVEVKSSRVAEAPYDAHLFQLAAYCWLVHKTHGKRPPYGILHYPNRTFAIDYTPELEAGLKELLAEMRKEDHRKEVLRSHESAARCRGCGFRPVCDQKVIE